MSLARIERLLEEIKKSLKIVEEITSLKYEDFISDVRNRYTLRLALVEIVEASTTLGLIILKEYFKVGKVDGYIAVFKKLAEYRVLSIETSIEMQRLVRLRNLIIHRYWEVDDTKIYTDAKSNGLNVIKRFIKEVEEFVSRIRGE